MADFNITLSFGEITEIITSLDRVIASDEFAIRNDQELQLLPFEVDILKNKNELRKKIKYKLIKILSKDK